MNSFVVIISLNSLSPNTVTLRGTGGWDGHIGIWGGHSSAHHTYYVLSGGQGRCGCCYGLELCGPSPPIPALALGKLLACPSSHRQGDTGQSSHRAFWAEGADPLCSLRAKIPPRFLPGSDVMELPGDRCHSVRGRDKNSEAAFHTPDWFLSQSGIRGLPSSGWPPADPSVWEGDPPGDTLLLPLKNNRSQVTPG